ncbi:glycosyl transferase family 2 [Humitalea rosea]|uniref:Glycosyl transferase family 2 n=1 Tax=Humitalea rosea TaxID=990373 RepID=A0A2W7IQU7_9PROT|nr:glycosyltransferase family A protein [Humitalea rosea]PZW48341.1 glycosyl transferase family 2 [Humitalea rosea]
MSLSLIVATRGRTEELSALFDTLRAQGRSDLEVIVVDQNGDDRLGPIMARHTARLMLRWLRSDVANACHARNLGLRHARGDVVGFPDDDCLYLPYVLDRVAAGFAAAPDLAILSGPAASPEGGLGSGRWRAEGGAIDLGTVWTSVIEFNLFLRREVAMALGGFDERMGPGTPFGSCEGNDLVARAIEAGHRAAYDPSLRIEHPDKRLTPVAVQRAGLYGAGFGLALRRHAGLRTWANFVIRPAGGMVLSALHGRGLEREYYAATLCGRLRGLMARPDRAPLPPLEPA